MPLWNRSENLTAVNGARANFLQYSNGVGDATWGASAAKADRVQHGGFAKLSHASYRKTLSRHPS